MIVFIADPHIMRRALNHPDVQRRPEVFSVQNFLKYENLGKCFINYRHIKKLIIYICQVLLYAYNDLSSKITHVFYLIIPNYLHDEHDFVSADWGIRLQPTFPLLRLVRGD